MICLATVQNRGKDTNCYVVDVSGSAGGRVFLFFCERQGRGLQETIAPSKAVPEVLDMKYRSKFKHGFTNQGYSHCAILKSLYGFQEKRTLKSRDMQFLLQDVPNEIFKISKMFENNMKFARGTF